MNLQERITNDLHDAMKSGDAKKRDILRFAISAFKNETVSLQHELSDTEAETTLARVVKQLTQAGEEYAKLNDSARAEEERSQAEILKIYLPTPLTEEEIRSLVDAAISETGAADIKSMGQVIQAVKAKAGNSVDGGKLATIVREKLA